MREIKKLEMLEPKKICREMLEHEVDLATATVDVGCSGGGK